MSETEKPMTIDAIAAMIRRLEGWHRLHIESCDGRLPSLAGWSPSIFRAPTLSRLSR